MTDQIGAQLPQPDPRGWLVFDHLPADLQNAEDSRAAADYDRSKDQQRFTRPATEAECTLLAHLGFVIPTVLDTHVQYDTPAIRTRRWPTLEGDIHD